MLLFGHPGVTLGIALLLNKLTTKSSAPATEATQRGNQLEPSSTTPNPPNHVSGGRVSRTTSLVNYIDLRVLLIASLLPDFIDKPLGRFFFSETIGNGRIYAHTLLFLTLVALGGLSLYQRRSRTWLLVLSFGIFTHLIFDQMWRIPRTLFWPLYGFAFERSDSTNWLPNIWHGLLANPGIYVPELAGAVVLVWFGLVLLRKRKVSAFIKSGHIQ